MMEDLDILLSCRPKELRVVTEDYRYTLKASRDRRSANLTERLRVIREAWTEFVSTRSNSLASANTGVA
jgi:hypothetical protein